MSNHLIVWSVFLGFFQSVLCQRPVCIWNVTSDHTLNADGIHVTAMNGLYTHKGVHNNEPYYTKESCHANYSLYYASSPHFAWHIYTSLDDTMDWGHCDQASVSNISSCSVWFTWDDRATNDYVSDANVFTRLDSCPSWSCDQISIPSLPNACNDTFDVYLGNNTWKNSLNNHYWYFNPLYFRWECDDSFPDFCNSSPLAYTAQGWINSYNGTESLSFESPNAAHDVHCIVIPPSDPPTSSPSNNPSIPPTDTPTSNPNTDIPSSSPSNMPSAAPITPSPTYKPSDTPSFHPTPERLVLNGTVINITVILSDSVSMNDVANSVNKTLFTYLLANDIAPPLETVIIKRGTIIIASYGFLDVLDTDYMNSNAIERQISQELEDKYQNDAEVTVSSNQRTHDSDKVKDEDNVLWIYILMGIAVFVVCMIAIIYFWFCGRRSSEVNVGENKEKENVSNDSMYDVCEIAPVITTAVGKEEPGKIQKDTIELESSDSSDDDLYIVETGQKNTTSGNTNKGDDDDDELYDEDDEDLDQLYDKAHKTVGKEDTKGGEIELIETQEGVKDSDDDSDNDTDTMYAKPDTSTAKGIATKK